MVIEYLYIMERSNIIMIIYKTTNLINGRFYVGQDKYNNPNYYGSGKILKQSFKKYGKENFTKEILEYCSSLEYLNKREIYWINILNAQERGVGYNISKGGSGGDTISNNPNKDIICQNHSEWMKENNPTRGRKRSEEEIEKGRISYVGKYKGENNPMFGKPRSEETKQKIREKALGRIPSEETRKKISKSHEGKEGYWKNKKNKNHSEWMKFNNPNSGKTISEEHKQKLKDINSKPKTEEHKKNISLSSPNNKSCIVDDIKYRSVAESSRILGISENTIRGRIKNKNFTNYNYE